MKKDISILSHIEKKLQAQLFLQTCLTEKTSLAAISIFANIEEPVISLLYDLKCKFLFEMTWLLFEALKLKNGF